MKIIIPMAGKGTRLRPHTLLTPKPLLHLAGKSIVQRLAEDIVSVCQGVADEIAFVIGDFGEKIERDLVAVAEELGAEGRIFHQESPLGTAHAIWQAAECLEGETIIAFADTLFRADFSLNRQADGVIWVKEVSNPEQFGVVTLNKKGEIAALVEKPETFVSDLAIIGIYYMNEGRKLKEEIRYLLENDVKGKGEYQLTDALENLRKKGAKFVPGKVSEWMDCGNKAAVLDTNRKLLAFDQTSGVDLISKQASLVNSVIIPPCFIGNGTSIRNSVIGPDVSIGDNSRVEDSVIRSSILQNQSVVRNMVADNSMIGSHVRIEQKAQVLDLGDYSGIGNS